MSLAEHVRTLGRGPGRSRSLTQPEAEEAMRLMLSGQAAPEAIGALLMLLRMKGETAEEIAGFSKAAQPEMQDLKGVDLDWPSYAAGRTRGAPWFLLSARLVAMAGHKVLLHGWNGPNGTVRAGLQAVGIRQATGASEAAEAMDQDGIVYLPLEDIHPALFRLLGLRQVLGLRSCINTVCRMLNPGHAKASVQGVFHPSYRLLQADAAQLLGWDSLSVIKGGGGEFERHPAKEVTGFGLRAGQRWSKAWGSTCDQTRRMAAPGEPSLAQVWAGAPNTAFQRQIVLGTAALALDTLGHAAPADHAARLWRDRCPQLAA